MVFRDTSLQCHEAVESLIADPEQPHAVLLGRSCVISMVTAIEVYFKDVLDGIFRICDPTFFEPLLKKLHSRKYDISDLVDFYRHKIHPLELIAANQSFQSAEAIDAVFSNFVGRSLWSELRELRFRFTDDESKVEHSFDAQLLTDLKNLFALRHELVHDPAMHAPIDSNTKTLVVCSAYLIFGVDIILMNMIAENEGSPPRQPKPAG